MSRLSRTSTVDEPLSDDVRQELDALEAALRGDPSADEALAALVRDVRAQAPELPMALREQLDRDVEAGFARRGLASPASTRSGTKSRPRRWIYTGGGVAVAGCCALAFAVISTSGFLPRRGDDAATGSRSLSESVSPQAATTRATRARPAEIDEMADAPDTSTSSASSAAVGRHPRGAATDQAAAGGTSHQEASSATPPTGRRRVERSVDLRVRVKSGELPDAASRVGDVTRAAGGYVADSRVTTRSRGSGTATFTLQVASSRLDRAIAGLSDLGTVTRQDQASRDITSSFDAAGGRLRDAQAVRRALLRSLDRAATAGQIASLRARIADNRRTIARLETSLRRLERRADLTTIALAVYAPTSGAADPADDGRWSLGDAAGDAGRLLVTILGGLLVAGAAFLPVALLAGLVWIAYRVRRRRERDAALGD